MRTGSKIALAAALAVVPVVAAADVPLWLRLVHWVSGDSDRTDVAITMMGPHMQMSRLGPARPGDDARARAIVAAAGAVLRRYPDAAAAERDGYRPFHETGAAGEEIHFTSLRYASAEKRRVDYAHPGSLLFRRGSAGLEPVGVMYGAPPTAGAADLDARVPLSVATWHRHVDFCWATGRNRVAENSGPRFGYAGSIHDEAACRAGGGYWLPLAFGWMTHVYPGRADPWRGETMMPPATAGMAR